MCKDYAVDDSKWFGFSFVEVCFLFNIQCLEWKKRIFLIFFEKKKSKDMRYGSFRLKISHSNKYIDVPRLI